MNQKAIMIPFVLSKKFLKTCVSNVWIRRSFFFGLGVASYFLFIA